MIRPASIILALSALLLGCSPAAYKIANAVTPGAARNLHKLPTLCCSVQLEWAEGVPVGVEPGRQWSSTPVDYVQVNVREVFADSVRQYSGPSAQTMPITITFQRISHRHSLSMETGRMFATWEFAADAGVTCSSGRTQDAAHYTAKSERFNTKFLGSNQEAEVALLAAATQAALKLINNIGNTCLTGSS